MCRLVCADRGYGISDDERCDCSIACPSSSTDLGVVGQVGVNGKRQDCHRPKNVLRGGVAMAMRSRHRPEPWVGGCLGRMYVLLTALRHPSVSPV